jgi:hypothetical protein
MNREMKLKKSRKRLAYGIIVAFLILCFLAYYYLQSNQAQGNQTSQPEAAIVDHLSFRSETTNQTFVDVSRSMLEKAGFVVGYYRGGEVNVDFYKSFLRYGYSLIVLRVHSAIIGNTTSLGLFTSEHFDYDKATTTYYWDVYHKRLVEAYFTEEERERGESYFAIAPHFIEEYGNFRDTTIIMMGCDGLKHSKTAEAFIKKGAKVCIGWNGLVSTRHTDLATTCLLQSLTRKNPVSEAVENTLSKVGSEEMYFQDQGYYSTLKYYPLDAGSHMIQLVFDISYTNTAKANTFLAKEEEMETI